MLDNLLSLVKQHAGNAINANPAIPNERNDEAAASASDSIFSSLKNAVSGGGLKDLLGMFGGGGNLADHPVTQNAKEQFSGVLSEKFGLNTTQASSAAESLIPNVMNNLVQKTNDTNDSSFNFQDIMGKLSGNSGGGIDFGGMLTKFKSGAFDADKDGDTDLQDAMKMLGVGGNTGGGIMDKVKGMFGG